MRCKFFRFTSIQEIYEWNKHLTDSLRCCLGDSRAAIWITPIVHGFFQQVLSQMIYVVAVLVETIIFFIVPGIYRYFHTLPTQIYMYTNIYMHMYIYSFVLNRKDSQYLVKRWTLP